MIGANIRRHREIARLTQLELADKIGVSKGTVSSWEVGRTEPNMGMMEKLASVLSVSKSELMGEIPPSEYIAPINNTEHILLEMSRKMDDNAKNKLFMYALELLKEVK